METTIPTGCIGIDPHFGNIRGIVDTALVPSVKEHGILNPLIVRPSGDDGIFWLVCGGRRFAAANALNLPEVPVIIRDIPDSQVTLYQMTDITGKELPIVVVRQGRIVGGQVVGIKRSVDGYETGTGERVPGKDRLLVAAELSLSSDTVGAMYSLTSEPMELVERVANEDMGISVYSRMKSQPWEFKAKVLGKGGQITMAYVMDMIAKWNAGGFDDGKEEAALIDQDEPAPGPSLDRFTHDEGEKLASPILQKVKHQLQMILDGGYDIDPADEFVLSEICDLADEIARM